MANPKRGRKNKYFTHVKPRFDEIAEWCTLGMMNNEIAENLGIGKSAFYEYLNTYPELLEHIKKSRKKPVTLIKSALLKRACGYDYEETTVTNSENGETIVTKIRHLPPDPASAMILLKHWAKDEGWTNDPASLALKKREIELKEKQIENDNW